MRYALWLLAAMVVLGTTFAGGWAQAQTAPNAPVVPAQTVLRGNDLGFRVEGRNGDRVTGRLVIWNGERWIETEFGVTARSAR